METKIKVVAYNIDLQKKEIFIGDMVELFNSGWLKFFTIIKVIEGIGIKDVNGIDLFDGDIIDIEFGGSKNEIPFKHLGVNIYWDEFELQWAVRGGNMIKNAAISGYYRAKYKRIGSIYDECTTPCGDNHCDTNGCSKRIRIKSQNPTIEN